MRFLSAENFFRVFMKLERVDMAAKAKKGSKKPAKKAAAKKPAKKAAKKAAKRK